MPYTPVSFVDGTTALNAANLNQLEDGVEAAERTENKGQPGGYPALDADGKVPSAQLPATGGSAALGEFQFSTTITEPPASGRIRMNNADQTLATLLWISDTTSGAVAVGNLLGSIVVGEQIYIQDKNNAALYRLYDVTALPVAKAGYHEVAVSFNKGAGAAFANNETLFCTIQRLAGGGADLDYEGDYVAATEYQDGDVVVKDGVAYLCVGGPTTVAPDIAPWGAGAMPPFATKTITDWNTATENGWYRSLSNATNWVDTFPALGYVVKYADDACTQHAWDAFPVAGNPHRYYARDKQGGVWSPWVRIAPGRGTSLPSDPQDGQEHILVDSLTAPNYQWRFRYNAQSSHTHKWEYIGGAPGMALDYTDALVNYTNSWTSFSPAVSFVVLRSGYYLLTATARVFNNSATTGLILGWSNAFYPDIYITAPQNTATLLRFEFLVGPIAPATINLQHYAQAAGNGYISMRHMTITPVRVS